MGIWIKGNKEREIRKDFIGRCVVGIKGSSGVEKRRWF